MKTCSQLLSLIFVATLSSFSARAAEVGAKAVPFEAMLVDGSSYGLAQAEGRVLIINYWATWCGPCREELAAFEAYYRTHHEDGLDILAVSIDEPGDAEKVRAFAKTLSFPVALLADFKTGGYDKKCQKHGVFGQLFTGCPVGIPVSYVIDQQGILRLDATRSFDEPRLEAVIAPLLKSQ